MSKQERTRKSAPHNRAKSFADAVRAIEPPIDLLLNELERFDAIITSREHSTWTPTDIFHAARLAQMEVESEGIREAYQREGLVGEDHNGKPILSKYFDAYHIQLKAIGELRRSLGLSASQRGISGHKQAKRNQQDMQAKEKISSLAGLIARPDEG